MFGKRNDGGKPVRCVLLMTACIRPRANAGVVRKDVQLRLRDYEQALRFWMAYDDPRITGIVFAENSGYDLASLEAIARDDPHGREVEFIRLEEAPPPEIGGRANYGYSEADIMDRCMERSRLLAQCDYMIKTTGRLYFPRLSRLLDKVLGRKAFIIDCRKYPSPYLVTTLFITTPEFYREHLYLKKECMREKPLLLENFFYETLWPLYLRDRRDICLRFPVNVPPHGIGAHADKDYEKGLWGFLEKARGWFRIFCPWLWV